MQKKVPTCGAWWVLNGVVCDEPSTCYFALGKPYKPTWIIDPPGAPISPPFASVEACDDHANRIENTLRAWGHDPIRKTA